MRNLLRSFRTLLITATCVLAIVQRSSAQSVPADTAKNPRAAQPERPTVATHAGTVAPGFLEIETGVERDQFARAVAGDASPTVLKFGIADNVQLSVFGGLVKPSGESLGIGDMGVGIKWRLVDDAPLVGDFAILPSIKFPTGATSHARGTGTTDAGLLLISSHDLSGTALDINVGYVRRSGDGSGAPRNATVWTVSLGGDLAGHFGYAAEIYGYPATSGPSGQAGIVAVLAGPTFEARPSLVFDAGVIIPLTGPQPHALYAGAVYNVGRLWSR